MARDKFIRVKNFVLSWQRRNDEILKRELKKHGVGVSEDLYQTLSYSITEKSKNVLHAILTMQARGRFVDMGVGKGVPLERVKVQRQKSRGSKRKRLPKKWYSKPFYGRLNDMQGVVGHITMDEVSLAIQSGFE